MNSSRPLLFLLLLALEPALAWPVPPDAGDAPASGFYTVNFNLSIASTIPAGAIITCKAKIIPSEHPFDSQSARNAGAPAATYAGVAAMEGSKGNCALEIPVSWTVNSAHNSVTMSYEIQAVARSGAVPEVMRTSGQQRICVALPQAGSTAILSFNVTL